MENKPIVGITHGDINGIGYEVIIKAFADPLILEICTPVVFGSGKAAGYHRKALNMPDFSFNIINSLDQINLKQVNLLNCIEGEIPIELGKPTPEAGQAAVKALEVAVDAAIANKIDVLVTAPINKQNIQSESFTFPGHTEYLAMRANTPNYLMLLVSNSLRVGTVTGHVALKDVAAALTTDKIVAKLKVLNKSLANDFGTRKPRIAVLGLNPHAGDNGVIGAEEQSIIIPAIKKANDEGIFAFGPYGADGFFGSGNYANFDGILAMYHDQGLIPFKALAFGTGVNFTAGLPFVRTSPDHGTGYDIAGQGKANPESLLAAIYQGIDILRTRQNNNQAAANPLPFSKGQRERGEK